MRIPLRNFRVSVDSCRRVFIGMRCQLGRQRPLLRTKCGVTCRRLRLGPCSLFSYRLSMSRGPVSVDRALKCLGIVTGSVRCRFDGLANFVRRVGMYKGSVLRGKFMLGPGF